MRQVRFFILTVATAMVMMLALAGRAVAASTGVVDDGHFFSADAVARANAVCQQIEQRHHKDLKIETWPAVPSDLQARQAQDGSDFWREWITSRARREGVNGVMVLICRTPAHLQAEVGNDTQHIFSTGDRDELVRQLADAFRAKQFDEGLIQGVQFVEQRMDANRPAVARSASTPPGGGAAPMPQSSPPPGSSMPTGTTMGHRSGLGAIACIVIAVVLFIVLVRGIFRRSTGGYYRGSGPFPGPGPGPGPGYPPGGPGYPPQAGYPPAGGYGAGGGGFGRGFLGGLLGGALGGYAAERWVDRNQSPGAGGGGGAGQGGTFDQGGTGVDTSYSSSGADFGGGGDQSAGADFGSSDSGGGGGGADFGSSDSGGGGSDFGGGGGGDAGSSSGSDF